VKRVLPRARHALLRPLSAALCVALAPLAAQAADPGAPDAGSILRQIQPAAPPLPSPAGTRLTIERDGAAPLPAGAAFEVKSLRISGNTLFDTPTLHALVAESEGRTLTLSQVAELAARITAHYRSRGYPLARAIIPPQAIRSGSVNIEVIEARYGTITLDNRTRVNDALLKETLSPLQSGQAVAQAPLDRGLLLLSDIPGVVVGATLKSGELVGTSDLLVNTTPGPAVAGNVVLDNYGTRYTGRARIVGTLNFINPARHGDVLSVNALSSGSGMNYGRITYESLLSGRGTRAGGSYSALDYVLGGPLASLNAHGTARVQSAWAKHPLVRTPDFNIYAQLQYDRLQLRDHIDAGAIYRDRGLANWTAVLGGDGRDPLLTGAVTAWSVGATSGRVGFDDDAARSADAATAQTQGGFSKWTASLARLQGLSPRNTLYLALSGQWTGDNLDPSQKMPAGGPYTVRAYDMGAISGDTGYAASAEFRHNLGAALGGRWQAVAFADSARVSVNRNPWAAGANAATLNGAGAGLNWAGPSGWNGRAYVASPVGSVPVLLAGTASTRAWIEIGKAF
jgi:hemolysin activation/secretion protein